MVIAVMATMSAITASADDNQLGEPTIMSLDFCADQYVLSLAAPAQIKILSPDAQGEYSYLSEQARGYPSRRPLMEIILKEKPEIVVRQWGGGAGLLQMLEAHTIKTVQLDYVSDFDGIVRNIKKIANTLGQSDAASENTQNLQNRREKLKLQSENYKSIRALYVTPGGVTAAKGTMMNTIMKEAGLINVATLNGNVGWSALPAEVLVQDPPDLLITGFFDSGLEQSANWSAAKHPVFRKLFRDVATIAMPLNMVSCAGPNTIKAAEYLQEHLREKFLPNGGS